MKLSGQTVLITGGAAGIGLALTRLFAENGSRTIVVGRDERKLNALQAQYPEIAVYVCDLGNGEEVDRLADQLYRQHPDLSVVVNNAGVQFIDDVLKPDPSNRTAAEIAVNLTSPIRLTRRLLPLLAEKEQAAVVNVTSGLGLVPKKSAPVYCATKAGLHLYTKALRYQLEHTGIKVFEIIPPVVDTDMTKGRGKNKISPERLAKDFAAAFRKDRLEVPVGKVKLLMLLNRWVPRLAERILKSS